ncbi:GlsB/YeaQ/YmgE family stress response membrane protein [Mastigocladus laminosus UU774]|nr:MAG: GlsB/YeaQ/YmgE family stress response membrane protein [Hapalosiphonaceae cyanobacterium JJU2]TBR60184.1 transglycosylase [Westiellopsis prolifica IICB1]TFI54699.1 GlsB/YeaQ/YmgE family stress response membrane protein [Mastigocladus laminosus UU774]
MINLIAWIILGLIAGAIAKAIYPGRQGGGIVATMLLGIIGSLIGGSLFNLLNTGNLALTGATFSIPGLIVAIIGAIIAIFIWSLITRRSAV